MKNISNKTKRLIISGIPCTKKAWCNLFLVTDNIEQKVLSFYDVFANNYKNRQYFDLVRGVQKVIEEFQPDVVVLHDIGVSFGLLALIRLLKNNQQFNVKKVILFNGVFRDFNVLKSRHPLKIQLMKYASFQRKVESSGGEVDEKLSSLYADLRHLYRQIAYSSIKALVAGLFKSKANDPIDLRCDILIIASTNDPYIDYKYLTFIERDFKNCKLITTEYGHYPYSGDQDFIRNTVALFESECDDAR